MKFVKYSLVGPVVVTVNVNKNKSSSNSKGNSSNKINEKLSTAMTTTTISSMKKLRFIYINMAHVRHKQHHQQLN